MSIALCRDSADKVTEGIEVIIYDERAHPCSNVKRENVFSDHSRPKACLLLKFDAFDAFPSYDSPVAEERADEPIIFDRKFLEDSVTTRHVRGYKQEPPGTSEEAERDSYPRNVAFNPHSSHSKYRQLPANDD